MPTTMYVRPLWVGVDCVEVGTCAAISLARILEARGYAGWKIGGYSIYILGGLFRFVRLLRFERFCVMRYGENGAPGALQKYVNGPLVNRAVSQVRRCELLDRRAGGVEARDEVL